MTSIDRRATLLLAATACVAGIRDAAAQAADAALLPGSWRLTAVYDLFEDGSRRETWGAQPRGLLQLTPGGLFSVQIVAADRAPRPGTVPTEPVGPSVSYWGRYRFDPATRLIVTEVEHSSWPQWSGTTLRRTIPELTSRNLKVVSVDAVRDPARGPFKPYLEFERIE